MHLSIFSDSFLSDRLGDSGAPLTTGQAHRDGVLRGMAMLGVFALLAALVGITSAVRCADADAAPLAHYRAAFGRATLGQVTLNQVDFAPVAWSGQPRDKVRIRATSPDWTSPLRQ